jgi:hypothetical protein
MDKFIQTFAPTPPPDTSQEMLNMIVAMVTLGVSGASAPFFNGGTMPICAASLLTY